MNYKKQFEDNWENAIAKGEPFNASDIALQTTIQWIKHKRDYYIQKGKQISTLEFYNKLLKELT